MDDRLFRWATVKTMARHETDREDLLAEGVNLPERGRIIGPDQRQWVAGWRNGRSISLFVDQDPVFHFNAHGEIRRAFVDGSKLAAKDRRLCTLIRVPNDRGRISLNHEPLSDDQADRIQEMLRASLNGLREALNAGDGRLSENVDVETVGIPANHFRERLLCWIDQQSSPVPIAEMPNVD